VGSDCQLHTINEISGPMSSWNRFWQLRKRLKRILKRRLWYVRHAASELRHSSETANRTEHDRFNAGEVVCIRSEGEIRNTLDRWNRLHGCSFMEEMLPYCGTKQRVLKRVERFLDERDYRMKKCKGIVILEGVVCEGTKDFGPCDRACFLFWRDEWLKRT